MSLISKTYTFSNGSTIFASEHNVNFDILFSEINGNLDNTNIKANAGIVDTKLATINTANKVGGSSFSGLASTPSGAGIIPIANGSLGKNFASTTSGRVLYFSGTGTITDSAVGTTGQVLTSSGSHVYWASSSTGMSYDQSRIKLKTFALNSSTSSQLVTDIGFTPVYVNFSSITVANKTDFRGYDNGIIHICSCTYGVSTLVTYTGSTTNSIIAGNFGAGNYLIASVSSFNADGCLLSITEIGSAEAETICCTFFR